MIAAFLTVTLGFLLLAFSLHLALAVYQVFFGMDGRAPWNTNPNLTYDEEMERWWEFGY